MTLNPSTKPQKLTESGLARDLGVSRQAVHELVKRGILSKDKDGKIDAEMAKIALLNRVHPSSKTLDAITPADTTAAAAPAPPATDGKSTEITSYHVAKTLREAAEAQMARIKLAEMQGKYLEKIEVDSAVFEIARALRDGLTNCARRIAADVAGLTAAEDCEAVIDREHRALLDSMTHSLSSKLGASLPAAAA